MNNTQQITYTALRALLLQNPEDGRTILMEVNNQPLMVTADQALTQEGTILVYRWQLEDLMATGIAMSPAIQTLLLELAQ